jgi:hypothetical protein
VSKILPPGMAFPHALRLGYTGEIRMPGYLAWVKTLPCWNCQAYPPSDASHPNFFKSQARKAPDPLALPEDRRCHDLYEQSGVPDETRRLAAAALVMLQAIYEGKLVWKG